MTRFAISLLISFAGSCCAVEPGAGYKLVEQTKPDEEWEFFEGPHVDTLIEVYSRPDKESFFSELVQDRISSTAASACVRARKRGTDP